MLHDDVIALLETNVIGDLAVDLFWGNMPDDPDGLITVYEQVAPSGRYTKQGQATSEARLQVLSRDWSYADAMARAMEVYTFLDHRRWTVGGVTYYARAIQRPFDVGATDNKDRNIISCNYALTLT